MKLQSIRKSLYELGAVGPMLLFAIIAPVCGVIVLSATNDKWLPAISEPTALSFIIFISAASVLAGLSLIPTHAVSLVAGLCYGSLYGSILAITSVSFAALVTFGIVGKVVGNKFIESLLKRPKAQVIYEELLKKQKRTILIIALVRLSPAMPFAATNILLSTAKVKLFEYITGSVLGLLPRVILVVIAGAGLNKLDFSKSSSIELVVLGGIATLVSLVLIGKIAQQSLKKICA